MTQPATYELTKVRGEILRAGKAWYKWTVQGDPVWADNFSKNVRIGQVRVLTGRPGTDPNTGRFRLEDAKVVRPSRILFFSNFAAIDTSNGNLSNGSDILSHAFENYNRCYVNPSREDGDINLAGIPMGTHWMPSGFAWLKFERERLCRHPDLPGIRTRKSTHLVC